MQPKKTVGEPVPSYSNLYSLNDRGDDIEEDVKSWTLRAFLHNYYVPFLKNKVVKVMIITIFSKFKGLNVILTTSFRITFPCLVFFFLYFIVKVCFF